MGILDVCYFGSRGYETMPIRPVTLCPYNYVLLHNIMLTGYFLLRYFGPQHYEPVTMCLVKLYPQFFSTTFWLPYIFFDYSESYRVNIHEHK